MPSVKVRTADVLAGARAHRQKIITDHNESIQRYHDNMKKWKTETRKALDEIKPGVLPKRGTFDLPSQPAYPGNEPSNWVMKDVDNYISMLEAETRDELSISDSSPFVGFLKYIPKK